MGEVHNTMSKKKIDLSDALFSICILLFLFSGFKTSVSFFNDFFSVLENIKLKYFFAFFCFLFFMINCKYKNDDYKTEFKKYIFMIFTLFTISFFLQLINGFHIELVNEIMYFLTPLLLSYSIIKYKKGHIENQINCIFYFLIILFLLIYYPVLSFSSILSIDFINSYSPYESGIAFYSILLFVYYLFNNDKKKCIVSFVLCLLSFKRITFLFLFIFIIYKKVYKRVKLNYLFFVFIFTVIPFVLVLFCNQSFSTWFYNHTGLDLNSFMKGRFEFIRILYDSDQIKFGLGSARKYLSEYYINYYNRIGYSINFKYYDPHCDLLRFYLECGFPGLFIIVYTYFKNASKSKISLFLVVYVFIEAIVNHIFGAGNTIYWVLLYLILYHFNYNFKLDERDN